MSCLYNDGEILKAFINYTCSEWIQLYKDGHHYGKGKFKYFFITTSIETAYITIFMYTDIRTTIHVDRMRSGDGVTLMCTISDRDHLPSPFWNISWYNMNNATLGCSSITRLEQGRTSSTTCNLNTADTLGNYKCVVKRHPLDAGIIVSSITSFQHGETVLDKGVSTSLITGICFACAALLLVILFSIYNKAGEYYDK